jgi:SAM-dependent methyltransferase
MEDLYLKFRQETLSDGGPQAYKNWAQHYEDISVEYLHTQSKRNTITGWMEYHQPHLLTTDKPHVIFDAGCGTGLVGLELMKRVIPNDVIRVFGGDLSPDMIEIAKAKDVYADLRIVNLKQELPYDVGSFDSVICVGTILPGHCGVECLPNLIRVLKIDGYMFATLIERYYSGNEWKEVIEANGCEVTEERHIEIHDRCKDGILLIIHKK